MNNSKFLGICILISAVIVSMGLIYHAQKTSSVESGVGRYQFHQSNPPGVIRIIDTVTGEVEARNG
jgi:hypothetical protein